MINERLKFVFFIEIYLVQLFALFYVQESSLIFNSTTVSGMCFLFVSGNSSVESPAKMLAVPNMADGSHSILCKENIISQISLTPQSYF